MNRIEEKLYLEIVLDCERQSCLEVYGPDTEAVDPMNEWASRNAALALKSGWSIDIKGKILCPYCSESR